MIQTTATFENGVFRPDTPLQLLPNQRVRLVVEPLAAAEPTNAAVLKELEEIWKNSSVMSTEPHLTRDQLHERR